MMIFFINSLNEYDNHKVLIAFNNIISFFHLYRTCWESLKLSSDTDDILALRVENEVALNT